MILILEQMFFAKATIILKLREMVDIVRMILILEQMFFAKATIISKLREMVGVIYSSV
jgi:hypothetical protein